jgi:RHS repeat-associated protein
VFSYNLRFPGQYFDVETGKHYNYFRDYDPAIGRYVESDPAGLRAGLNTFGYADVSPILFTDRFGLMSDSGCCARSNTLNQGGGDGGWVVCCEGRKVACVANNVPNSNNDKVNKIFKDCAEQHERRHFQDMDNCPTCTMGPVRIETFKSGTNFHQGECPAHQVSLSCFMVGWGKCGNDNQCKEQLRGLIKWDANNTYEHCRFTKW